MSPHRLPLLCLVVGLLGLASRADAESAATFEGAAKLYRKAPVRLEDIYVPPVEVEAPPTPPEAKGDAFQIQAIDVVGSTLLAPEVVRAAVQPFLGPGKHVSDIQQARDAVQRKYAEAGFPTAIVSVPQQRIADGRVRLEVTEARIGNVVIENPGRRWYADERVREDAPSLREGNILRGSDLESEMRRANAPDHRVTPVLKPGQTPGTADVELTVDDRLPLHAGIEFDNDHTIGTPADRTSVEVSYDDLWNRGHRLGLNYQFVPSTSSFDDVQVWALTYSAPLPWGEGQQLTAYGAWSDSRSLLPTAGDIQSLGRGFTGGLRYTIPLDLPGFLDGVSGLSHSLTLGVDYKDIKNTLQSSAGSIASPITYLPWSIAWDAGWLRPQSYSTLRVEETFNFAGTTSGGSTKDFQANRGGVKNTSLVTGDFVALKVGLRSLLRASAVLDTIAAGHPIDLPSPERSLLDDWTVAFNVTGEWSNEPLVSTEQLPLGGSSSVRGYLEGERFGDHGFDLQLELRTARWSDFAGGRLGESLQGVIFYDYGEYWLLSTERGKGPYSEFGRLQGIGAGLRARLDPHGWVGPFTAEAFFAYPTVKTVSEPSSVRLHFRVRADF